MQNQTKLGLSPSFSLSGFALRQRIYQVVSKCDSTINYEAKTEKDGANAIQMLTNPALRNDSHDTEFGKARRSLAALDQPFMPPIKGDR